MAIELNQGEARRADGLTSKGKIIETVKGWHKAMQDNSWLLDEWDDEFVEYMRKVTEPVAGSLIVKP